MVSVLYWPSRMGALGVARSHSPSLRLLAAGFLWFSGKTKDASLQAEVRQEVLVACLAQRTMTGFPNYGSKLISEKSPKCKF